MMSSAKAALAAIAIVVVVSGSGGAAGSPSSPEAAGGTSARQAPEGAKSHVVEVPRGGAPTLDGVLSPGEWDAARQAGLTDGSKLLLMHDKVRLFIGIRAEAGFLGSLCLDRGGEVAVLHSSAALGTAIYEQREGLWQRIREFDWRCRDTSDSPEARQARKEHFKREGWVASNGRMGEPTEMEFMLDMPEGRLRLAVTHLGGPGWDSPASWPVGLGEGCRNLDLIRGDAPDSLPFSPDGWMTLRAAD